MPQQFWLKMTDAVDDRLESRWIETNPELLTEVRSSRRPSGIQRNDLLVYYASSVQKIYAIARMTESGDKVQEDHMPGEERWPWLMHVQVKLAVPDLRMAPSWSVMSIDPHSVSQQPYIEITKTQYRLACKAIADVVAV
jgi:hypothetical protein